MDIIGSKLGNDRDSIRHADGTKNVETRLIKIWSIVLQCEAASEKDSGKYIWRRETEWQILDCVLVFSFSTWSLWCVETVRSAGFRTRTRRVKEGDCRIVHDTDRKWPGIMKWRLSWWCSLLELVCRNERWREGLPRSSWRWPGWYYCLSNPTKLSGADRDQIPGYDDDVRIESEIQDVGKERASHWNHWGHATTMISGTWWSLETMTKERRRHMEIVIPTQWNDDETLRWNSLQGQAWEKKRKTSSDAHLVWHLEGTIQMHTLERVVHDTKVNAMCR